MDFPRLSGILRLRAPRNPASRSFGAAGPRGGYSEALQATRLPLQTV